MKNSVSDKIAIIDIGSNSVRMFIFQVTDKKIEQITAMKSFCGLGKDLGTTGLLNPEAVLLTHAALDGFRQEIRNHNISSEIVIGTAALREAEDADEFLNDVKIRSGFEIRIIEGSEEARLAALAVLSNDREACGIVADFGGGSLELARIGEGVIHGKVSLKLGAHYLKARSDRGAFIDSQLQDMLTHYPEFNSPRALYIIGGSWRSLAKAWIQDRQLDNIELEGFCFNGHSIINFCSHLQNSEPDELVKLYHMEVPRAALMDVSALMLEKLIINLQLGEVKVSTAGIRDGLAYDYILKQQK